MNNVLSPRSVSPIRDERYATLWETSGVQTGLSSLSAAFVEVDVGATSPLHWHESTEEIYMIVEGKGIMYFDGHSFPLTVGDCVSIPLRVLHAVGNVGNAPLRMWVATSPPYDDNDDFEIDEVPS